jgi:hypothetical protein
MAHVLKECVDDRHASRLHQRSHADTRRLGCHKCEYLTQQKSLCGALAPPIYSMEVQEVQCLTYDRCKLGAKLVVDAQIIG